MNPRVYAVRRILVVAGGVLAAAAAVAEAKSVYIEQVSSGSAMMGQPASASTQKVWYLDGDLCVQDVDNDRAMVFRGEEFFLVDLADETYSKMTGEQMKALAETGAEMLRQLGQDAKMSASVRKTGETAEVREWDAYEVVAEIEGPMPITMRMWLSDEVGIDMGEWAHVAKTMQMGGMFGDLVEQLSALEGFPVKQETSMSMMGRTMTQTTEVTKVEPGPDKLPEFCGPPASFKQTEGFPGMSGMPGQRQR